jgi:TRAP-type C4-dicarboxylate transport system permease small subunit
MIQTLDRAAAGLSTLALWVSAALLVYIVIHINVEIFMRTVMSTSTFSMDEFVGYAIGSMTFLSLAHTFRSGKHIRVTLLSGALKGRAAMVVDLICIALTFAITAFVARYIWRQLERDWTRGTVSPTLTETPIWIIDAALFAGLVIFLLQLLASAAVCVARREGLGTNSAPEAS